MTRASSYPKNGTMKLEDVAKDVEKVQTRGSFRVGWSEANGVWIASSVDHPGLFTHGDTPEEAIKEAQVAAKLWVESYSASSSNG